MYYKLLLSFLLLQFSLYAQKTSDAETVKNEHAGIGISDAEMKKFEHTTHPDAQWFPEAGLGLFPHWGLASVKGINISWSMIEGLNGKPAQITPFEYWAMAKDFNPQKYDPYKWIKAAKEAGFTYAVLTTRHHEGFALWPSKYGSFNTKNYMGGRDLVKDFADACRKYGLKVGFYYSPPDWYFDQEFFNFSRNKGESLGPDLKPRIINKTPEETTKHQAEYAIMIKGQVEELLTNYGKIDLLWFDGRPKVPEPEKIISLAKIRELQPGIVVNPRLHGQGDYKTFERQLTTNEVSKTWAEYCNTWTGFWPHVEGAPFRSPAFIIGQYAKCRSLGINYLIGVGPTADGEFCEDLYKNLTIVGDWMKINKASVQGTKPLPPSEKASVPATMSATNRYLFAIPQFKDNGMFDSDMLPHQDISVTIKGVPKPKKVKLLQGNSQLDFSYNDNMVTIKLPASKRTNIVDVICVSL